VEVLNSKPVVEVRSINTGQTEGGAGQDQPEPESGSKKLYFGHLGEPEGVPSEPQPQPLAPTAPDGAQLSGEPSGINPNTSQDLEPVQTVEACMAIVEPSGDLPEPYAGRWVDLMARRPEDRRRPWSREAARACFDDLSGAERYLLLTGGGA
jgi:hypothetical protein